MVRKDQSITSGLSAERHNVAGYKCGSIEAGVTFMSFRNGDKSRENRIRKARQKKRKTVRQLKTKAEGKSATRASATH
jgi:hypothetical protein